LRLRGKNRVRGVDLAGHVEAVGKNVTRFKPGTDVFGAGRGSFADYAIATEDYLAVKPRGMSFQQAACLPVAGLSALQALRDKADLQPGQRVLIHGAGGGVGTFAVQIAKALGARVTAVTHTRNLDVVRALDPDEIIDYTKDDFTRGGQRFDAVVDIAATRPTRDCLRVLVPGGTLVQAGAPKTGGMIGLLARLLSSRLAASVAKQRVVSLMARARPEDLAYVAGLVEAGKVSPVIERQYSLSDVPEAIRYVKTGQARAKVVISID
jgi:NADPH:quinone reductase-like Zn-dependent oxidoreductase